MHDLPPARPGASLFKLHTSPFGIGDSAELRQIIVARRVSGSLPRSPQPLPSITLRVEKLASAQLHRPTPGAESNTNPLPGFSMRWNEQEKVVAIRLS